MTNDLNKDSSHHNSPGDEHPPKISNAGPSPLDESRVDLETMHQNGKSSKSSSPFRSEGSSRHKLPNQSHGPLTKILLFLALPLLVYSLAGFFLAPYLLTTTLPAFLAKKLNRPVTIGSAKVNPYTLNITLKNGIIGPNLAVADDKVDPVLSFGRIQGRINPIFFLKKSRLIKSIRGTSILFHLTLQKDGLFNISTLMASLTKSGTAFNFVHLAEFVQAGDITITNSRLIFTDQSSDNQHVLEEISFSLPKPGEDAMSSSPLFSAIIDGSPLSVGGQTESSASGQHTRLTFSLENIHLADYLAYLPRPFPGLLTKGEADMELVVDYRVSPDKTYHIEINSSGVARDIWLYTPEQGENKIASANFTLSFDPLLSQLTISKLVLDQPEIQLFRRKDGTYTFPGAEEEKSAGSSSTINIETLVIKNGRLSYIDQKIQGGFGAIFNNINLNMDRANKDALFHAYALNCVTSRKTRIASQGTIAIQKGNVDGLLILHNLPISSLNSYLPSERSITLSAGIIDKAEATLQLNLHGPKKNIFRLSKIKGSTTNLDIYYQGKEWLHVDQGLFTDMTLAPDFSQSSLGTLNISGLLGHFSPDNTEFLSDIFSNVKNDEEGSFTALEVKNGTLLLHNFSFQKNPELLLNIIKFTASGFGKKGAIPGKIHAALSLPPKAKCMLQGDLSLAPLAGTFQLNMQDVPLNIFSLKQMNWFVPEVHDGALNFSGTLSFPHLSFLGSGSLANFLAKKKSTQENLIRLKKASTPEIHLAFEPFTLQVNSLDLNSLELFTTLSSDVDSLASLFFNNEKSNEITLGNIAVKEIDLRNGALHFSDRTLNPPFSKSLTDMHGSLTNLTNSSKNSLSFDISGTNEDHATMNSKGTINLFTESFSADFSASLLDQPLTPFIPYLEPMVGHSISDGIFNLSVSYNESSGKVNADTFLTLRDFTLGDLDLGNTQFPTNVALVTDNDRIIRLTIPISGDMTDPSYTFHSAYGKKIRSLISKASVSPFSILTEFYDPEQPTPDHILFEVGDTDPTPESNPQLLIIKDILTSRPLLTLTVKGYSSGTEDRDALLKKKQHEAEKKRLALQNSLSSDLIDSYGKEEIETPPATSQGDSTTNLTVSKEELLTLAKNRCLYIKEILIEQYGIADNRIFISPDTTVVPETGAGLAGNRADFILGQVDQETK